MWYEAARNERAGIIKMKVASIVPRPKRVKVIKNRYVFNVKACGLAKGRLVLKDYVKKGEQREYSPQGHAKNNCNINILQYIAIILYWPGGFFCNNLLRLRQYFPQYFPIMKGTSSEACSLFFTRVSDTGSEQVFKCSCGTTRKQKKGSGFSNLMSHLREKHGDWEQIYEDFRKNNPISKKAPAGHVFFVNPKVVLLHSWLDWIVTDNLPICTVEKSTFRNYSNLEAISVNTFIKYLKLVEAAIDIKLKEELPAKFGLVIDGWTEGTTHYFGVYAAYAKSGKNYTRFLTIAPPFDETRFTAQAQADFLVDVLENVSRTKEDILFLVADNTNTNPATADLLDVRFFGCASHRVNPCCAEIS